MFVRLFIRIALFSCLNFSTAAHAEKKVALIIGNSDYTNVIALKNPRNDASEIGAALKRIGFEVETRFNLDYRNMRLALRDFSRRAADADITLVYFAGHGIEVAKSNYLIPISAELKSDRDIDFEAIPLDSVLNAISSSSGVKILLLDACRDNPFRATMNRQVASRSIGRGLARVDPVRGVVVGFAARGGTVALDGDGPNSPYALALLKYLEQPGLEIGRFFRKVRDQVILSTDGRQEPFTYGSLPGNDIYLAAPAPQTAALQLDPSQNPTAPEAQNSLTLQQDFAIAERTNNVLSWRRFIDQHGTQINNPLVKIALRELKQFEEELATQKLEKETLPWLIPEAGLKSSGVLDLTRDESRSIQTALGILGYETGGVDGNFGPKTLGAIAAARFKMGLSPGTSVDQAFLKKLPNVPAIDALKSMTARRYSADERNSVSESRLKQAMQSLFNDEFLFDYYDGKLYVIVLRCGYSGWADANRKAKAAKGHLATINSAAENQFLFNLFRTDRRYIYKDSSGHWHGPGFGLFQPEGSREPAGGWTWVTGEPLKYRNWSQGNPDNHAGRQKYGSFFSNGNRDQNGQRVSKWDDGSSLGTGCIIEID